MGEKGVNSCPTGFEITDSAECLVGCDYFSYPVEKSVKPANDGKKCYLAGNGKCRLNHAFGSAASRICKNYGKCIFRILYKATQNQLITSYHMYAFYLKYIFLVPVYQYCLKYETADIDSAGSIGTTEVKVVFGESRDPVQFSFSTVRSQGDIGTECVNISFIAEKIKKVQIRNNKERTGGEDGWAIKSLSLQENVESELYIQLSYSGETSFWVDGDNSCTKGNIADKLIKADVADDLPCCKDGAWCDLVAGKDDNAIILKCFICFSFLDVNCFD